MYSVTTYAKEFITVSTSNNQKNVWTKAKLVLVKKRSPWGWAAMGEAEATYTKTLNVLMGAISSVEIVFCVPGFLE